MRLHLSCRPLSIKPFVLAAFLGCCRLAGKWNISDSLWGHQVQCHRCKRQLKQAWVWHEMGQQGSLLLAVCSLVCLFVPLPVCQGWQPGHCGGAMNQRCPIKALGPMHYETWEYC